LLIFENHVFARIVGAPRSANSLVAESATGKVLTQHISYQVLSLHW
jgi:hypothetical protein